MSSITKRQTAKGVVYRARYRDPEGREHCKHFPRKRDAQSWLDEATATMTTGTWINPKEGKTTFKEYAEGWRARQMHRPSSAKHVESHLRVHAYPAFGHLPMADVRASTIQAWVKQLSDTLAPSTVRVAHGIVAAIFRDAVGDRVVTASPCDRTKLPELQPRALVIPTPEQVAALHQAMTPEYRALVHLAAATGVRQAEAFGLTVDRVDFLRREVTVDRQLLRASGEAPVFGPPKTKKSHRTIPVPGDLVDALASHITEHGTGPDGILFKSRYGGALKVSTFNGGPWRTAVSEAKCPDGMTFHWMRHYYASRLIAAGLSVKAVQVRLGHATAAETLDTYSHLWPTDDDRTRDAAAGAVAVLEADQGADQAGQS